MSNNPRKRAGLLGYGLEVVDTIAIEIKPNEHNEKYLTTKRDKMGHDILNTKWLVVLILFVTRNHSEYLLH